MSIDQTDGDQNDGDNGSVDRRGGWKNRVTYAAPGRGGFAYRPTEVITTNGEAARSISWELWQDRGARASDDTRIEIIDTLGPCVRLGNVPDPLWLVAELRLRGVVAQLNHVLFIHCGCCGPHPASAGYGINPAGINPAGINPAGINPAGINPAGINPAGINPAGINPAGINPAGINPAGINPAGINPAGINPAGINPAGINPAGINPNHPARVTGMRRSSARPAVPTTEEVATLEKKIQTEHVEGNPKVIVLDTGLAGEDSVALLSGAPAIKGATGQVKLFGVMTPADDVADRDQNQFLDPAAGHGTFIAGIVSQVAPGCQVSVHRVASIYGDTDEFTAAGAIAAMVAKGLVDDHTLLNLSFGGYAMDDEAIALAWAIRGFQAEGGVVVASAGNDSTCQPAFPAALPGVVSVGAIGPGGPALFTNFGPWVRACAPGVDITSLFFEGFNGLGGSGPDGTDPDSFSGWARWSGTSFSAPVVVGALARMMMWSGCTAVEAVERVVDPPSLMRIPNLGTVVNVI